MNNNQRSVGVLGTGNTFDFERVMNHFSSSFTESYLKVMDSHFGNGIQLNQVEEKKPEVVKPMIKNNPNPKVEPMNLGFEKLKNPLFRTELEKCKSVEYDESRFITIKELGFKTIYDLDKRSNGFWKEYFSKNKVYLKKGLNTSKISSKVLFDRTILGMIKGKKSEQNSSGFSLPE
jgi:hypothetical protein